MTSLPRLLGVDDLAEKFPVARATFYSWRARGTGPRSSKLGGRVVYLETDVLAWLEAQGIDVHQDGAA